VAGRRAELAAAIRAATDSDAFLVAGSNLPGPRANLELIDAAGDVLAREDALRLAALDERAAPSGSPLEFLPCCGLSAVGRLVAEDDRSLIPVLRAAAGDPRWRVREAVAIALQRWGDADVLAMAGEVLGWASGTPLEARAAVAAICEPRLLRTPAAVDAAVRILDTATTRLIEISRPRGEPGRVLGLALGYAWSVAVAASPAAVLPAFERWAVHDDPDVARLVRLNLSKARFRRVAPEVAERLSAG
jgi:hypothetical protein